MNEFLKSSDSRETSQQILDAIWSISNNDEIIADRIWSNPTDLENQKIYQIVTKNGEIDPTEFCWGVEGSKWGSVF